MELRLNIEMNQLLGIIGNLSYEDKLLIKKQIDSSIDLPKQVDEDSLQQLLLSGPIMTDEEYEDFNSLRKQFGEWAKK